MKALKIVAASALLVSLWACERPGPAERVGQEIDEAIENIRNGGETVGNRIDDAVDEVRDTIDDVRRELAE